MEKNGVLCMSSKSHSSTLNGGIDVFILLLIKWNIKLQKTSFLEKMANHTGQKYNIHVLYYNLFYKWFYRLK